MNRRVAITGAAGISPVGNDWATVRDRLRDYRNAVEVIEDFTQYEGLNSCERANPNVSMGGIP